MRRRKQLFSCWMNAMKVKDRQSKWPTVIWVSAAALILLLPLVAMQLTDQVAWDAADFAFAAILLFGAGATYEFLARNTASAAYRAAVGVALATAVVLVWINAAVGLIGDETDPGNLMLGGVLAIGVAGALLARFHASGMARALFVTAAAQALVAVIALAARLGAASPKWPFDILVLTVIFVSLWTLSALLFKRAAREQDHAHDVAH
jgi:hypothetical protein